MDDALRQGDDLVTDYDSMIAKLIVHGSDRNDVIERGKRALAEFDVEGFPTVIPFHRLMLTDEAFVASTHTTKYLDETLETERIEEAQEKWGTKTESTAGDGEDDVVEREFTVEVNGKRFDVDLEEHGAPPIDVGDVNTSGGDGPQRPRSGGDGSGAEGQEVTAEMQGTILEVGADKGDEIEAGDVLCVLEAMKMENDIVAERGGVVNDVAIGEGDSVDMGDLLFVVGSE